jgi:RNA polymerase sigma factor FliA
MSARPADVERLVREHLHLAKFAIHDLAASVPAHVSRDDLHSAALLGLVQAARAFDPDRGVPFDGFARRRIRGALLDELRSRDWAPRSLRSRARETARVRDQLSAQLGRPPSDAELAVAVGVGVDQLEALRADLEQAQLDSVDVLPESNPVSSPWRADDLTPLAALLQRERVGYLHDAVALLPARLRRVVTALFFDDVTPAALAAELGVTESRISQLRGQALGLLREAVASQLEPHLATVDPASTGRADRKVTAYVASVASASDYRVRLGGGVRERVAAAS